MSKPISTPFHLILRFQQDGKGPDARRASAGLALANASERNNADGRLSSCPKGVARIHQCGVAALDKGRAIAYGLRLALVYLGDSEVRKIR
jgi:hypothetical protein